MKNIPALTNERQKAFIDAIYEGVDRPKAAEMAGINLTELRQNPAFFSESTARALQVLFLDLLPKSVIMLRRMLDENSVSRDKVALAKLILDKAGVQAKAEDKAKAVGELSLAELHAALAKAESKLKLVDQKPQASKAKLPSWLE